MQGPAEGKYVRAAACLKHYAVYSEETHRMSFPAVVTAQDMVDTYLPAFEEGVERGHAVGIMCSYNAETFGYGVLGPGSEDQKGAIPSCANKYLMNDLARGTWGFDGYITSDCGRCRRRSECSRLCRRTAGDSDGHVCCRHGHRLRRLLER